jgi:hypothetical protein
MSEKNILGERIKERRSISKKALEMGLFLFSGTHMAPKYTQMKKAQVRRGLFPY